jgi:hypothetical protein
VTTPFHAEEVRKALAPTQPLVIVGVHPAWWQTAADHSGVGTLPLLCVDRSAGERIRHGLGPDLAQRVRVVALDSLNGEGSDGASATCLATLAARARMKQGQPVPQPDHSAVAFAPHHSSIRERPRRPEPRRVRRGGIGLAPSPVRVASPTLPRCWGRGWN